MRTLLATLTLLLALTPAAAGARKAPPRFMGVNWDDSIALAPAGVQAAQFPRMASAGVETVRVAFSWAQAQPAKDGPIDLSVTDRFVELAAARHVEVFPHVILAPDWDRLTAAPFAPPKDPAGFQPYVQALIARYGPAGTLWDEHPELPRTPIRYWQFWNEPHLPFQWTLPKGRSKQWPQTYVSQLKVFYRTVKDADRGAKVVLGGLANMSWTYLRRLYRHGAHGYFDIAAIHPYTTKPSGVVRLLGKFRKVMRAHRDRHKPVWVTELGLPASRGRAHSRNTLQTTPGGMARYLSGSYAKLLRRSPRVYWYTWASLYRGRNIFSFTGLFRYTGGSRSPSAQPAYKAYLKAARRAEGCRKTRDGLCR